MKLPVIMVKKAYVTMPKKIMTVMEIVQQAKIVMVIVVDLPL